jgi:hypothetical protein
MKTFIINEEEKMRILEMHETATKSLYLSEQQSPNKSYVVKVYDDIVNAVAGPGTNEDAVLEALKQIQTKEDLKILFKLFQNKRTGYSSFVDMVNTEYEQENYQDVENIRGVLNKLGVKTSLSSGKNYFKDNVFSQDFKLSF